MESRASTGRFRSNRIRSDKPPENDGVVHGEFIKVIQNGEDFTEGFLSINVSPNEEFQASLFTEHGLHHAGGIQSIGDYLAVGLGHAQEGQPARVCVL